VARRRQESLFDLIAQLPWWVGVVSAALVYVGVRFVVPAVAPPSPMLQGLAHATPAIAWMLTIPFLAASLLSGVRQYSQRRLFEAQTNLESVRGLSWQEFERLVAEAFSRQGYFVEERGGSAPDGGIDLELWKSGKKAVVQCKHWRSKHAGVNLVRELYGVMTAKSADEAIFVCTGDYTEEAQRFADGKPIRLINGSALLKMINAVQPAPSRSEESVPTCPKCARPMVMRTARSGSRARQGFWGCSAFPQCRGTRPLS